MAKRFAHTHRRRGATAVLVAVTIPVMLSFAALTIDVGYLYNVRTDLQNAADAAAMAGAAAYTSDAMVQVRAGDADALADVMYFGRTEAHRVAALNYSLGASGTLIEEGDIVLGWIDTTSATSPIQTGVAAADYNAVQVTVRRTAEGPNGPVNLIFAPIFGKHYSELAATAVAVLDDKFSAYETSKPGPNVLPITMYIVEFEAQRANGDDLFTYEVDTESIYTGPDETPEINLYPGDLAPGNFGLLNIGATSQSLTSIAGQIEEGVTPEEFEQETGSSLLAFFDDDDSNDEVSYEITGNPGLKAALEDSFTSLTGQVVAFFVHDNVVEGGSNATYTVTGIRFGILMEGKLQIADSLRGLWVQPIVYEGPGVTTDPETPSSGGIAGRIVLAR